MNKISKAEKEEYADVFTYFTGLSKRALKVIPKHSTFRASEKSERLNFFMALEIAKNKGRVGYEEYSQMQKALPDLLNLLASGYHCSPKAVIDSLHGGLLFQPFFYALLSGLETANAEEPKPDSREGFSPTFGYVVWLMLSMLVVTVVIVAVRSLMEPDSFWAYAALIFTGMLVGRSRQDFTNL